MQQVNKRRELHPSLIWSEDLKQAEIKNMLEEYPAMSAADARRTKSYELETDSWKSNAEIRNLKMILTCYRCIAVNEVKANAPRI